MRLNVLNRAINRMQAFGRSRTSLPAWSPADLFLTGAEGWWYDPSDLTTMYTDRAGTTLVSPVGTVADQPVGLILDKSQGLVLGADTLGGNGNFNDAAFWSSETGSGSTVSGGVLTFSTTAAQAGRYRNMGLAGVAGLYLITFDIVSISSGGIIISQGNSTATGPVKTTVGRHSFYNYTPGSDPYIRVYNNSAATVAVIDNLTVFRVSGNHATAPSDAARPLLSARVNLLTKTEDFADAAWVQYLTSIKIPNFATAPDGTTSACRVQFSLGDVLAQLFNLVSVGNGQNTFGIFVKSNTTSDMLFRIKLNDSSTGDVFSSNLTATPTWQFFSYTAIMVSSIGSQSIASNSLGDVVDILVWHPQLELGSAVTPYQRVNTDSDYNAVGFPHYLKFDGVDDSLQTPVLPAILNASGFAGLNVTHTTNVLYTYGAGSTDFIGEISSGGTGVPDSGRAVSGVLVNAVAVAPYTAGRLYTLLSGAPAVLEHGLIGDAGATSRKISGYGGIFNVQGSLYASIMAEDVSPANAVSTREWVADKTGVVI